MLIIAGLFIRFSITTTKLESEFRGQHIKSTIIKAALPIKCILCILNTTDNKEGLDCISDITVVDLVVIVYPVHHIITYNMTSFIQQYYLQF